MGRCTELGSSRSLDRTWAQLSPDPAALIEEAFAAPPPAPPPRSGEGVRLLPSPPRRKEDAIPPRSLVPYSQRVADLAGF